MAFENLRVERIVLHEVYKRLHDGSIVAPAYGQSLIQLSEDARQTFRERIVDAIGSSSHSMEMQISSHGPESAIALAASLLDITDNEFLEGSRSFADSLAAAQLAKNLPGGVLVVFGGAVGAPARKFVGILKAEKQSGFRRDRDDVRYFTDLFLTPASKLYKIGFFVYARPNGDPTPAGWKAHVYDSHLTSANRDGAAKYFYETFLGCSIPQNSAYLTRSFFSHTRDFIRSLAVEPEVKDDLLTSLYTYLKVDQTPSIEVNVFSQQYLPAATHAPFREFMRQRHFPLEAVAKDITDLGGALRKRRIRFPGSIELTAPPEAFKDSIKVESFSPEGADVELHEWTRITIKSRIRDQE